MFLLVHIKVYKNNFFIIISNVYGKVLFSKSSGILGFKNIHKRSSEAFSTICISAFTFIIRSQVSFLFLKYEGIHLRVLRSITNQFMSFFKKYRVTILGFKVVNKIPHNGCRKL